MLLIGKPSISMGHLYHGYVSHNQMVNGQFSIANCWHNQRVPFYWVSTFALESIVGAPQSHLNQYLVACIPWYIPWNIHEIWGFLVSLHGTFQAANLKRQVAKFQVQEESGSLLHSASRFVGKGQQVAFLFPGQRQKKTRRKNEVKLGIILTDLGSPAFSEGLKIR